MLPNQQAMALQNKRTFGNNGKGRNQCVTSFFIRARRNISLEINGDGQETMDFAVQKGMISSSFL